MRGTVPPRDYPVMRMTTMKACLATGVLTTSLTIALGPGFAVATAQSIGESVQDVFVTNDAHNPVAVDASGHTITINGSADVSGSTVKVDQGTVPFQRAWSLGRQLGPADSPTIVSEEIVTVPAGKRLTITDWSVADNTKKLGRAELLEQCNDPVSAFTEGVVVEQPNRDVVHETTTFEVGPGCKLQFLAARTDKNPQRMFVSVTGHWTPVLDAP